MSSTTALGKTSCISVALALFSLVCNAQLRAGFSANPLSGCAPLVVRFTDQSTGNPTQWRWDLGNATTSFLQNPSVTYFNPGQYTIKLVIQNASGRDSIIKNQYITIYAQPTVIFSASSTTGCYPLNVQFIDASIPGSGSINSWQWDFGDGTLGTTQNPSHTYMSAGNYNVTLKVGNSYGCIKTLTRTQFIQITEGVQAAFSNNVPNSCTPPVSINFINLSTGTGALTYLWNFGDGTTSTQLNPSHNYNNPGSYTVSLIVRNSYGCTDTITKANAIMIGSVNADFNQPDTVCINNSFIINNTSSPAPVSAFWDFGDGTTSTDISPSKFYSSAGIYQVKMISNFGTCTDSITKSITVLPKPITAFIANPVAGCRLPHTVTFGNTSTNAVSYQWDFGDGTGSTQASPGHIYYNAGIYTVRLISTNASGCNDTLEKQQYINVALPEVTINNLTQEGCAPFTWTFTSTVNSLEPVISYQWDFGDGTNSTAPSPTHTFGTGIYSIRLIIVTASGCSDTTLVPEGIKARVKPVANFNANPRDVCARMPVNFFDLSTGTINRWQWDFGDGGTSTEQNPTRMYEDTGYFSVRLIVYNNSCADTIQLEDYIHITPPIAIFSVSYDCNEPFKRTFMDASLGADEWHWNFGDGDTSILQHPVHTYGAPGIYPVTLTVKNYTTGCEYSRTYNTGIVSEAADFSVSDTVICRNNAVAFSAINMNQANIASYIWSFGDGSSGTGSNISHTYMQWGAYDVSLIITDTLGCSDTLIKYEHIRVNGPSADFSIGASGTCLLSDITFIDNSTDDGTHPINRWIWNYGDGNIDTLSSGPFRHQYSAPGIYTVALKVIDNIGCSDSISNASVLTISKPVASFNTPDTLTCPNQAVVFTNNSTGPSLIYRWDFGDSTSSTEANPSHQYFIDGIYSIKLVIYDQYGCSDSMYKPAYVRVVSPIADFSMIDSISNCPPFVVNFTNQSQNFTGLNWDFGDGTTSQLNDPSHFYSIPGTYIASLAITGPGGCTSIKQRTIVIKGPQGSFTYAPLNGCKPMQVNFTASTRGRSSFVWDFNDGTTLSTTDSVVSHIYIVAGTYVPKMILLDAGGCVVPITGPDTIIVNGIMAEFTFTPAILCDKGMAQFSNSTVSNDFITGYLWDFGDSTFSTEQNPSHFYDTTGIYYPKLTAFTQSGCIDSTTALTPMKVVKSPVASLTRSGNGCTPLTVSFSAAINNPDTSAITWQWNFGNNQSSSLQNPPAQLYSTAKDYQIFVIATNSSGCKDTTTTSITAFPIPAINAGADTTICKGKGTNLYASGAASYTWSPAAGLSCINCSDPVAIPDSVTHYTVRGTSLQGCINTDTVQVSVKYPFKMNISRSDSLCAGRSIQLSAIGASTYSWSPSTGLNNTNGSSVNAAPNTTILYRVIGTDDRNCFKDTGFIPIKVFPVPTVDAGKDTTINVGQTVDLVPIVSADVTNVLWTPTSSIFRSSYPSVTVKPRETTQYIVEVTNPGRCMARDMVTIYVLCNGANVFIPNTFSPNGDGSNDVFFPRGSGLFRIKSARVFDRWGEGVYVKNDFSANDVNAGWDGTFKGQKLNPDVYIYTFEIICDNNSILIYKGNLALIK